nr:MAG TPA: hypothetical protein [Caudoviricetes sp.]
MLDSSSHPATHESAQAKNAGTGNLSQSHPPGQSRSEVESQRKSPSPLYPASPRRLGFPRLRALKVEPQQRVKHSRIVTNLIKQVSSRHLIGGRNHQHVAIEVNNIRHLAVSSVTLRQETLEVLALILRQAHRATERNTLNNQILILTLSLSTKSIQVKIIEINSSHYKPPSATVVCQEK